MPFPATPGGLEALRARFAQQFPDCVPLFILAPSTRCGSTLLQRAINQQGEAIVYGENFIMVENLPLAVAGLGEPIEGKVRATGAVLDAFLAGERGIDGSALFPDYAAYRNMLWQFVYELLRFYGEQAQRHGYRRWGLKHQIAHLPGFHAFLQFLPHYRAITLYRDVVAVAKSMAARWPQNLRTEEQCLQIGRRWRDHLRYLLGLDRSRNLVLRYEELAAAPEALVQRIEAHLGVRLSREAFAKRVNAHSFDSATGRAGEQYLEPAELPPAKLAALVRGAEPLYGELGYRPPQLAA